jgi:four helix bundle protein
MGHQYVSAVDSISANLAEGWGRYHKKDKIKCYRYSFDSLKESEDWTRKAIDREFLTNDEAIFVQERLVQLPKQINQLIQYTNTKLKYYSGLINFLTKLFRLKTSLSVPCIAKSEKQIAKSTITMKQ